MDNRRLYPALAPCAQQFGTIVQCVTQPGHAIIHSRGTDTSTVEHCLP